MGARSDAADTRDDTRHFLDGASLAELLEAAQFRYLEIGVYDFAFLIEEYFYLAVSFQSGNGVDTDFCHFISLSNSLHDNLSFSLQHGVGQAEPVESTRRVDDLLQQFVYRFRGISLVNRSDGAQHFSALVNDSGGRSEAAAAGHIGLDATHTAAAAGGRAAADNALLKKAFLGVGDDFMRAIEVGDFLFFFNTVAFVAAGLIGGNDSAGWG
jgi:hypothetical protein